MAVAVAAMAGAAILAAPGVAAPSAPAAPAPNAAAQVAHGRQLFNDFSCSSCHTLSDAGAAADVGPSLDGNQHLTKAMVIDRVTHGQGAMPAFGGQMSDKDIDDIATYVTTVAKK